MTDYRRLTEKHIPDTEFCSGCSFDDDLNGCEIGGCDKYYMYFETYERLKKLEDMIESGELVNENDIKSENATLHKKLDKVLDVASQTYLDLCGNCCHEEEEPCVDGGNCYQCFKEYCLKQVEKELIEERIG